MTIVLDADLSFMPNVKYFSGVRVNHDKNDY